MTERFTVSLDEDLAHQFDHWVAGRGYGTRSEAVRDLIRAALENDRLSKDAGGSCVATLSYVYNHHQLGLASRLAHHHHEHHDLTLATLHVHLDHENCLEAVLLKGAVTQVRHFADATIAERGVRHGKLHMIPVTLDTPHRHHDHGDPHHHSHPLT